MQLFLCVLNCFVTSKLKAYWDMFTIYCINVSFKLSTENLSSFTMCTLYGGGEIIVNIFLIEQGTL